MIEKVNSIIQEECRLAPNQPVLAAVSGGPDSLCLVDMLTTLGYPVIVAHLDHGIRPESAEDAQRVQALTTRMGLPCYQGREDIPAYSQLHNLSLEEAAREVRYRFLFNLAQAHTAQAVATGHTADDQVETVLMHLLRGAGLAGLRGMDYRSLPSAWSKTIPLVRPLLAIWRNEIIKYIEARGLEPSMDATNFDLRFYRNRLRHELLPFLDSYNPGLRQRLWQMSFILGQDYSIIEEQVDQAWDRCIFCKTQNYLAFDGAKIRQQSPAIQRYLLRRAAQHLRPGLRDIDFASLQHGQRFIEAPSRSRQIDWLAGLRLCFQSDRVWLAGWETELPEEEHLFPFVEDSRSIPVPGIIQLNNGWILQVEQVNNSLDALVQAQNNSDPFQTWMDIGLHTERLTIRSRRRGDRFQPFGMDEHSVKLSDYMINIKLPTKARSGWPLITAGDQIAWLPGLRLAHPFRVREDSQTIIYLRLYRQVRN